MLVVELFSQPKIWHWVVRNRIEHRAVFSVAGSNYDVVFYEFDTQDGIPTYDVQFGRCGGTTSNERFGITNTGNAPHIFATVIDCITAFLREMPGDLNLLFSADEPSRVSLYRAMIRRLGLANVTTEGGLKTTEFTVKIRKNKKGA